MMKRVLGAAGVGLLVSSLGALAACGSPSSDAENTKSGAAALESANVSIDLLDQHGTKVGTGAGVLIAPNLVLTSAHLVAGKAKWSITTADGKTTVKGTRGLTYDWMAYDSLKSHPRKHDVAVIYLDTPIQLAAYPKIASAKQATGTAAQRVKHIGGSFELVSAPLGRVRTFPHAYVTDMTNAETVNTGGAVINKAGEIVGVVTGRGMQTSKLYIARTDGLVQWLSPKMVCAGGKTDGLSIRTYGAPPPKPGCEKDGGATTSSSGSSGTSGTSGGSSGTSGASGSSSGSSGDVSSGGVPGTCDDGGGECSGDCAGTTGGSSSGSSGSSGTSGSDGTTSGGTSGTSGTSGSSGSDDTTSGSSSGGGGTGDEEVCEGPSDNPDECPPEPAGCVGPECGGGAPDSTIDYGNCACSSGVGSGSLPVIR